MLTEDQLIHHYNSEKARLEEQKDRIKQGEHTFSEMLEKMSLNIFRMLEDTPGDVSEAYQFSRQNINRISEKYQEKFQEEQKRVQRKLEEAEQEFNHDYNALKAKE